MSFKSTNVLICDEVRIENTGKFLIIGMYTGPIGVPQIPIPFGLTFMHFLQSDRPGRFSAKFRVENLETGQRLVEGQAQIQVNNPALPAIVPIKVPLQIDREGAYHFILELEGERDAVMTPFEVNIVRRGGQPGMPTMMMPMA